MKMAVILLSTAIVSSSLFNLGTVRKKEDPVLKTQTAPISYKQKLEETKDGPKGAPAPSFNLYPKEKFMIDAAVDQKKEAAEGLDVSSAESGDAGSEVDVSQEDNEETEDWWGDSPDEETDTLTGESASKEVEE